MKKLIKLMIFTMTIFMIGSNAEAAKKISTNKSNISMKVGETKKIKVNVKNVKVKSTKIAKVTVKGKVVSIKGVKAGKAKIKFTAKKMKSKTVKVNVKKVRNLKGKKIQSKKNKKMTEKDVREKIDGYGDKYKDDIESYPYLDKKSYNKIDDPDKVIQRNVWKNLPDYLRDCIVYNKTRIEYSEDLTKYGSRYNSNTNGIAFGSDDIILKYEDGCINEHLVHEAAHVYDCFSRDFGVDVKKKVKNEYNNYPKKYGVYGSKNLTEFYAEKIERECLKDVELVSDDIYIKNYENHKVKDLGNGKVKIILDIRYYAPSIEIDNIIYDNGRKENDSSNHYRLLSKQYFDKLYDNYTFE